MKFLLMVFIVLAIFFQNVVPYGPRWLSDLGKVRSHTLEIPVDVDKYSSDALPHEHRLSNSYADYWADHAASIAEVSWGTPEK